LAPISVVVVKATLDSIFNDHRGQLANDEMFFGHRLDWTELALCRRDSSQPHITGGRYFLVVDTLFSCSAIWAGARSDKIHWSARLRVPRGPKRRQMDLH
jgi:hypothetical protein